MFQGRACAVYADCFYSLIEPEDLGRVQCVLYEGTPRICRIDDELVNLSRASALCTSVLGNGAGSALELIATCARYLQGSRCVTDVAARRAAAAELGIPRKVLDDAIGWLGGSTSAVSVQKGLAAPIEGDYS